METILSELRSLCSADNNTIFRVATELIKPYVDEIQQDAMGNILAWRFADIDGAPTVMLEAHIDEIGFMVTHIDERGFVFVSPIGGVDKRILSAQRVMIYGDEPILGVFSSVPPHLATKDAKIADISEMAIDTGLDAEIAKKKIPLGSHVNFVPNFCSLNQSVVSSKGLDNRSGMAAVLHCLRKLSKRHVNVAVAFCVQEELGCRGAEVAARIIHPDYALVTDVSFALTINANVRCCGEMRKGAMLGISSVLGESLRRELDDLANKNNIPYQYEVMAETTGTNADHISIAGSGVRTALISIPLRYMHTPVEMVDISDIAAVGDLMASWINEKGVQINE